MSTRIKGNGLMLTIDSEDYWADITEAVLDSEEAKGDVTTFEDAAAGGAARQYFISASAIQSTDTDSFWSMIWDHSGEIVPYVYAVHGNATPSASKPHMTGTCKIPTKPKLGGAANATYVFDARFDCQEEPTKVIA